MWNSLGSFKSVMESDAGKRMLGALEKTGDVLTRGAETMAKSVQQQQQTNKQQQQQQQRNSKPTTTAESKDDNGEKKEEDGASKFSVDGGEEPPSDTASPAVMGKSLKEQQAELTSKLKMGWGSMLEATQKAARNAKQKLEAEQTRISARLAATTGADKRPYRRDPSLPLDVDSLKDAEVVYITDRIVTMSHPAMQSTVDGDITPNRKLAAVAHLLHKRHATKYMVWNLSEVNYEASILEDQVLTFSFPGSPSPPLGLWLKLLISMESWLKADEENVAVVHCLTGKGRTSTVVAALLCWVGEAGFGNTSTSNSSIMEALDYIAQCKHLRSKDDLTIPSQRRYCNYFSNMLDGVRPSQPPLLLKRIIMSEAPKFAKGPPRPAETLPLDDSSSNGMHHQSVLSPEDMEMGCAPYLQIFKGGQLIFTTAAHQHANQTADELPFCAVADGAIAFHIETVLQGDVLVRCRHLTPSGQRVSMFRAAFHTGYVPPHVLRLSKSQLDGACTDKRFPENFFLDLIFEACDVEMASKHLSAVEDAQNEALERRELATGDKSAGVSVGGDEDKTKQTDTAPNTVKATSYDTMLHRDSRFWDVIAERRAAHATEDLQKKPEASSPNTAEGDVQAADATNTGEDGQDSSSAAAKDPKFWGPTIGRRRNFNKVLVKEENGATTKEKTKVATGANATMESFSIGGDFDFMSMNSDATKDSESAAASSANDDDDEPKEKPKDALMEALMGALEETVASPVVKAKTIETEEVSFESAPPTPSLAQSTPATSEEQTTTTVDDAATTSTVASEVVSVATTEAPTDSETESTMTADGTESDAKSEAVSASDGGDGTAKVEASPAPESTAAPVETSDSESKPKEQAEESTTEVPTTGLDEAANLLKDSAGGGDGDAAADDMDALLADGLDDLDVGDYDFDADDEELEDLENFLKN